MALETGSFISDLVSSNPPGTDGKDQGDDHLRLLKNVLQGSFPNSGRAYRIPVALAAKVAAYPIVVADENSLIQVDATAGVLTATLPTVASVDDGWTVTVMKSDASGNAVTVEGNGAETINGAANRTLSSQYQVESYMRDGSEWKVISLDTAVGSTNAAIELLAPVADEMIYFTALDIAAVTSLTPFARTILDDAAQANVQATLALTPGTDVQIFDAVLEDLAALAVVANNEFIVGSAAGVYAHESGAIARTSIGLGTVDAAAFASLALTTDLPVSEGGTGVSTFTDAGVLIGNVAGAVQVTAAGAVGDVLTGNGVGVDPTFQPPSTGGRLLSVQVFTTTGANTWTKPVGINSVRVIVAGAGGGGAGAAASEVAAGGGGGGYAEEFIDVTGTSSETATVGAGGTAGSAGNNAGGVGGTSSLGSLLSATGGVGGPAHSGVSPGGGGAGGVGTGGDINGVGGAGGPAHISTNATGGVGGGSRFGGGGETVNSSAGVAGGNFGGGGSGASGGAAAARVGGTGANGVVIVWEYT